MFSVQCENDAHIVLNEIPGMTQYNAYEVALGIEQNTVSVIMRNRGGPDIRRENTPNILSADEFRHFWISWDYTKGLVEVGKGVEVGSNSFLQGDISADKFRISSASVSIGGESEKSGLWEFRQTKGRDRYNTS